MSDPAGRRLIFDIGLHRGLDSKFFLDKGFKVVALEANPDMVSVARVELKNYIDSGDLVIVEKALWRRADEEVTFFANKEKDDWSSLFRGMAEREGHKSREIRVGTTTLSSLLDEYGVPYYIKCDIEGADAICTEQLMRDARRPLFVSVEGTLECLSHLLSSGYDRIQIINQALHGASRVPTPPREGRLVQVQFNGHMSGLFGLELAPDKWVNFDTAARRFMAFRGLRSEDPNLAHGWLDFHVTTERTLKELGTDS